MNRREFIQYQVLGVTSILVGSSLSCQKKKIDSDMNILKPLNKPQKTQITIVAGEINSYLRKLGEGWIDQVKTVDTFKAGNPEMIVNGIAVGWMSYYSSLKTAVELGCNLFITHEPTYYNHRDNDESIFEFEIAREKKEFIEKHNLSIIRCHDVWDLIPDIGITDAWASFLGFTSKLEAPKQMKYPRLHKYCGAYEIQNIQAGTLAKKIAKKLTVYGEEAVLFVGPKEKVVNRVAIGTGAVTPFMHMVKDLEADVAICSNDGMRFWRDAALAIDMDYPIIVVDHACSEEFGIKKLAEHVAERFPDVPVYHIPQYCMFETILG